MSYKVIIDGDGLYRTLEGMLVNCVFDSRDYCGDAYYSGDNGYMYHDSGVIKGCGTEHVQDEDIIEKVATLAIRPEATEL